MAKENRLTTARARLSYPALDKPRAAPGATEEKFGATLVFEAADQTSPAFKALLAEATRVGRDRFGDAEIARLKALQTQQPKKKVWTPAFHRGAEKVNDDGTVDPPYDGPGVLWFAVTTFYAPDLFDATGTKIPPSTFYPGCYVRARVVCYAWDHPTGGKGVSFGLRGVQFLEDGENLSGGGVSASEFDEVPGARPAQDFPGENAPAGRQVGAEQTEDADLPF